MIQLFIVQTNSSGTAVKQGFADGPIHLEGHAAEMAPKRTVGFPFVPRFSSWRYIFAPFEVIHTVRRSQSGDVPDGSNGAEPFDVDADQCRLFATSDQIG
jgi:hypothetical protein